MRWTLRVGLLLVVLWLAYLASPFLALYRLGKAVEAQDVAAIGQRVNFQALRLSLSKQIVSEYLRTVGRGQELDSVDRNLATSAGATVADPLIAQLVTPEAVAGLFNGRLPAGIAAAAPQIPTGPQLRLDSLAQAARIYLASQSRGFRNIVIPLPDGREPSEQLRLQLRLTGTQWRLVGLELPDELVRALVKQLPRGSA
jgi:hypothetical protein